MRSSKQVIPERSEQSNETQHGARLLNRCCGDKIIQVCCALINLQSPQLQEINDVLEPMLHNCGPSFVID